MLKEALLFSLTPLVNSATYLRRLLSVIVVCGRGTLLEQTCAA